MSDSVERLQRELHEANVEAQRYKREADELRRRVQALAADLRGDNCDSLSGRQDVARLVEQILDA